MAKAGKKILHTAVWRFVQALAETNCVKGFRAQRAVGSHVRPLLSQQLRLYSLDSHQRGSRK